MARAAEAKLLAREAKRDADNAKVEAAQAMLDGLERDQEKVGKKRKR